MPDEARSISGLMRLRGWKRWMGTSSARERAVARGGICRMGETNPVYIADSTHEGQRGICRWIFSRYKNSISLFEILNMLHRRKFSQYEKMIFILRNVVDKLLFFNEKIYILYKT